VGEWLERYRGLLFFGLVLVILAAVLLFQALKPSPQPILLSTSTPNPSPAVTATPQPLRVYVSGAVQQPDVYTLPPGSIVKDAVLVAGGPARDADMDRINLASSLADGQQVYVPKQGEESLPVQPSSLQPASGGKVNINTADAATLETLPGIGPALAQRILDFRQASGPFERIEDVMEVSGIGPGIFDQIRELIATD
jgi:competence protein ComEA